MTGRSATPQTPAGPLIPPDDPPALRRWRILRGIAREGGAFVVLTLLAPLVVAAASAVDAVRFVVRRKPAMALRLTAIVWWFLLQEMRGLAGVSRAWLLSLGRDTPARRRRVYALQVNWAADSLAAIVRLFRVRFEVAGDEALHPGPILVFYRHASIIDNALPARLISRAHGFDLRYVLKDDMAMFPTLDIGARWVPTCFVRRGSEDPAREIGKVRMLAQDLRGEREGVLIFPEGTRTTSAKLDRVKAKAPDDERVQRLRHLLPARPGGPLALLEAAPHAAVVVCGHVGLEGFHDLKSLWSGELLDRTVRVRFWRHERDEIPAGPDAQADWLVDRWQHLDDWVEAAHRLHDVAA
jgi:1-acyl-sn-glycerol-3-phosphate acyltransferase